MAHSSAFFTSTDSPQVAVHGGNAFVGAAWKGRLFSSADGVKWKETHKDKARINPVRDMAIFGDRGGQLDFSAYDCGLGELAWILESGLMQRELWETIKRQHNVTLLCPAEPARLELEQAK